MPLLSVAVNVGFLTGCAAFHDLAYGTPCKYAATSVPTTVPRGDDGKMQLVSIAESLGIRTSGKSASDLASDIRYALDRSEPVPALLEDKAFEKMANGLGSSNEKAVRRYQEFITSLQGKRVIVVEPEM